jgi:integrase
MSSIQFRNPGYQLRVKHKLLPKPFFYTFDTEVEARNYGDQMESLLASGIVPKELLSQPKNNVDPLIFEVIRGYTKDGAVTDSDDELFDVIVNDKPAIGLRVSGITFLWVERYVKWLKSPEKHLAPGTIRKRVGALGRALDWHIRQTTPLDIQPAANPLRLLPRGYSAYSKADARVSEPRRDVTRNRRLSPEEDARIRAALAGVKREDRERPFTNDVAFGLLYSVIVDTGLRLLEAYRLRADMIDHKLHIVKVEGSKGHRGAIKSRVLPIKHILREPLKNWCDQHDGLLFPYWDGSKEQQRKATQKLSHRFASLFEYAGVHDFSEHDLRHEAACRWFELRNDRGWVFSEIEICRIMGWSDTKMALRYASLRGEDLSSRLG